VWFHPIAFYLFLLGSKVLRHQLVLKLTQTNASTELRNILQWRNHIK